MASGGSMNARPAHHRITDPSPLGTLPAAAGAAYLAAALNLAAALALVGVLAPGLPAPESTPALRLAYIAEHLGAWWAGWLLWHAAALALLAFYVGLACRWRSRAPIRCGLALLCGAAGLAVDLAAQAAYMGVVAHLTPLAFETAEPLLDVLTGYLGNGLYTLTGLLLTWAGAGELPRHLLLLSLPVWIGGLGLSAASLLHSASGQFWSTAVLMPGLVLWASMMGRWLSRRAS
jgi:hypothetical protein